MGKIKEWWENNSANYQKDRPIPIDIHYGPGSPNEDELHLLGDLAGKSILEIGCGGAQCGIAFAKKGAKVTGIDISERQLEFARKLIKENNVEITLYQRDMIDLSPIRSDSHDIVFSAWALLYCSDLDKCFKEVRRVIRPEGIFVASLNHPFHHIVDISTLKIKRSYFEVGEYQEQSGNGNFVAYHRKISDITNSIINAGLKLENMIEPDCRKENKGDPWYKFYSDYRKEALKYFPRTIIFKSRK